MSVSRPLMYRQMLLAAAVIVAVPGMARAQQHYWSLNNTYADQYGGPSLTPTTGTLGANGYAFGANGGLSVTGVFSGGIYSIAFRAALDEVGGWKKFVDFSDLQSDAGYYNYFSQANLYPTSYSQSGIYGVGQMATTVLTRDAAKNMKVYVDGALLFNFVDALDYYSFSGNTAWFFVDDFATSQVEATSGFVDWIATYDVALDQNDVPIDAPTAAPEPATMVLMATGLLAIGGAARRRRKQ